jgi:hypothetical protein
MQQVHHHLITGTLAVIAAVAIGYAVDRYEVPKPLKVVEHQVTGKYGWGDMSKAEQAAAAKAIGNLDRREVQIFCGGSWCNDLADDMDRVFDAVQAASNVQRPFIDLGAGMGISPDEPATHKIAQAFKDATDGRIDLKVIDQKQPGGGIVIALGKKPRK